MTEPADRYRGIVAWSYDVLLAPDALGDAAFFEDAIRAGGEPALEVGAGTGRLLLRYLAAGLDVEGVDLSEEMLAICRAKASAWGLTPRLHRQAMEALSLPRRFRTLYVPAASFTLLADRAAARRALAAFRAHLVPGGTLLLPVFRPDTEALGARPGGWRLRREGFDPVRGVTVQCWERPWLDVAERLLHLPLRFDVLRDGRREASEAHTLTLRWYELGEMAAMLAGAGFASVRALRAYGPEPAELDDEEVTWVAR